MLLAHMMLTHSQMAIAVNILNILPLPVHKALFLHNKNLNDLHNLSYCVSPALTSIITFASCNHSLHLLNLTSHSNPSLTHASHSLSLLTLT